MSNPHGFSSPGIKKVSSIGINTMVCLSAKAVVIGQKASSIIKLMEADTNRFMILLRIGILLWRAAVGLQQIAWLKENRPRVCVHIVGADSSTRLLQLTHGAIMLLLFLHVNSHFGASAI